MRRHVLLVFGFAQAACANHAKPAIALYETGNYAGAARAADDGLASYPHDEALWQMRVRAALAQGDGPGIAKAYAAYRTANDGDDDKPLLRDLATATLGQALASPSVKLKVAAIDAVADAELEALADQVADRLDDDDDRVVAAAAVAIMHSDPRAPEAASEMLLSGDPEARRIAVDGVGRKVGKLALADLERAAGDASPPVRRVAIRWLGELKDAGAAPLLTAHLADPDEATRAAAATALAHIAAGDLVALARQALRDPALAVRLAGIALLVAAHQPAELAALASDPDPIVATEAAIAHGGGAPAATAIERAATAPDWTTRAGAANLAGRALGKPAALALARRLASDPELAVRLAAARVLAHAGDRPAAAAIFAAALTSPPDLLQAATDLAAQDDDRGLQALDAAVRDAATSSTARAAAASGYLAAHRITPALVAALADDSAVVRVAAAAALAMLVKH